MANIDVTEIVTDPDFQTQFSVVRSVETVDSHGRSIYSTRTSFLTGIVQPASGRTMELYAESTRTTEMIEIWTLSRMQEATDDTAADIVRYKDKDYIVTHTDFYDNYGEGYIHAVCTRKQLFPKSVDL